MTRLSRLTNDFYLNLLRVHYLNQANTLLMVEFNSFSIIWSANEMSCNHHCLHSPNRYKYKTNQTRKYYIKLNLKWTFAENPKQYIQVITKCWSNPSFILSCFSGELNWRSMISYHNCKHLVWLKVDYEGCSPRLLIPINLSETTMIFW